MTNELTIIQKTRQTLDRMAPEFRAVLPAHIEPAAFIRVAQTAMQLSPDLQDCTPGSLIASCTKAAEAGLQPDGVEGALVAYNVKVKTAQGERWERQAKFMPMVAGIRDLVRRSGQVKDWKVRIVRQADFFEHLDGDVESLVHRPAYDDDSPITHVYAIAYLENGELSRHVMTIGGVEAIRRRSKSAEYGPWKTDYAEMVKKTCLRQHSKALPKAKDDIARARIMGAISAMDEAEGVVDITPRSPSSEAPQLSVHEAASRRLEQVAHFSAMDATDEGDGVTIEPAAKAKAPRAARKTANERLAEAEGRPAPQAKVPEGNGRPAPAVAAQQTAAPSSSTTEPAGQSGTRAQPAGSPSEPPPYDGDGRDYDYEDSVRDSVDPAEMEGEDPQELCYRAGWHARAHGKPRLPGRGQVRDEKEAAAFLSGWDAFDKAVKLGNAPRTPEASAAALDMQARREFPR